MSERTITGDPDDPEFWRRARAAFPDHWFFKMADIPAEEKLALLERVKAIRFTTPGQSR